jgi:hypothetical protein
MPVDIHLICRHGDKHRRLSRTEFETGNWKVGEKTAEDCIGGHIFLHEKQDLPAWHGGTLTAWRRAEDEPDRLVFTYLSDGFNFRVRCSGGWGQEVAIVRS